MTVDGMAKWVTKQLNAFRKKKLGYWLRAAAAVFLGVWLGDQLSESDLWLKQRRTTYRLLHKGESAKAACEVGGSQFDRRQRCWLGELAGRRPTRRDYLGRLMRAAAAANPALIALDFNLRSPSPGGNPINHPDYQQETEVLLDTIREIALKCPVVISKALGRKKTTASQTIRIFTMDTTSAKQRS